MLAEVAFCLQIIVVAMFWTVIYPQEPWRDVAKELVLHGSGLVIMIADYTIRLTEFRMVGHRVLLAFSLFYLTLHVAVVWYTDEAIYPAVDLTTAYSWALLGIGLSAGIYVHKLVGTAGHHK